MEFPLYATCCLSLAPFNSLSLCLVFVSLINMCLIKLTKAMCLGFPCSSVSKESACSIGDRGSTPGLGRSPGEGNGNPLSILAWKISWTQEPGGLHSMGPQRVGHD